MCHNVSPGGICVGCALGLAVGERVTLTFRVSQSDPVDHIVPGRVVWVRRNLDSHIGLWRYLAAIAFDEPQRWISIFSRS